MDPVSDRMCDCSSLPPTASVSISGRLGVCDDASAWMTANLFFEEDAASVMLVVALAIFVVGEQPPNIIAAKIRRIESVMSLRSRT